MRINRAMLPRVFRFVVARASAAIDGGIAIELLEQWVAAIRNPTTDHANRAAFADGRAGFPIRMDALRANLPQPGGGEFTDRLQKVSGDAGCSR